LQVVFNLASNLFAQLDGSQIVNHFWLHDHADFSPGLDSISLADALEAVADLF
jgi:hypothetical protein